MKKRHLRLIKESSETFLLTLVVFLFLVTFVIQGYKVFGSCMEPNLITGERLLGNKFVYRFERVHRGDIIVFKFPPDPQRIFIKRVIALPGESVEIKHGRVYVNDRAIDEHAYVKNIPHDDFPRRKIPAGSAFVLGDNRDNSNDSRAWGNLPIANIQARAWLRYWPLSRMQVF
ncbi:MAG TPA: signal peptidase I [Armatimonadota bacterium]